MKKYYKVVSVVGDKRVSAMAPIEPIIKRCRVEYLVGKFVRPAFGKLMVFGDMQTAMDWMDGWREDRMIPMELWSIEVQGIETASIVARIGDLIKISQLKAFWNSLVTGALFVEYQGAPDDTYFADAVKLTKRIL